MNAKTGPHRGGVATPSHSAAMRRIQSAPAMATDTLQDLRLTASYADLSRAIKCEVSVKGTSSIEDHALAACVATPPDPTCDIEDREEVEGIKERLLKLIENNSTPSSHRRRREKECDRNV